MTSNSSVTRQVQKQNGFYDNVDINTECLVFGYVKNITIKAPLDIIFLCIKFYHHRLRFYHCEEQANAFPIITIATSSDFCSNSNKYFKGNIIGTTCVNKKYKVVKSGMCIVKNFKFIPKSVFDSQLNLSNKNVYDVIFNIAAVYRTRRECSAYIMDSFLDYSKPNKSIDLYHWILPSLPCKCIYTFALYSKKYGLISIGGDFNILKFTDNVKYEWKNMGPMANIRDRVAAIMVNDDNLFCCGGRTVDSYNKTYSNCTDMYDFNTQKWIQLANMNVKRGRSGICKNQSVKPTIYVAGGLGEGYRPTQTAKYKVESYDMEKNKWTQLCDTNAKHQDEAILWMDNMNILNVGSTTENVFEKMDLRENKWNIIVGNDNINFNTLFGRNPLYHMDVYDRSGITNGSRLII